jgi:hypothetical protein
MQQSLSLKTDALISSICLTSSARSRLSNPFRRCYRPTTIFTRKRWFRFQSNVNAVDNLKSSHRRDTAVRPEGVIDDGSDYERSAEVVPGTTRNVYRSPRGRFHFCSLQFNCHVMTRRDLVAGDSSPTRQAGSASTSTPLPGLSSATWLALPSAPRSARPPVTRVWPSEADSACPPH